MLPGRGCRERSFDPAHVDFVQDFLQHVFGVLQALRGVQFRGDVLRVEALEFVNVDGVGVLGVLSTHPSCASVQRSHHFEAVV